MLFLSLLLLLVLATSSNNVVAASISDEQLLPEQLEDMVNDIEPAGDNGRELKNDLHSLRRRKDILFDDAPGSKEQHLYNLLLAARNGKGNKSGVVKNIVKIIDEINDPNVVVRAIEAAGLSPIDTPTLSE